MQTFKDFANKLLSEMLPTGSQRSASPLAKGKLAVSEDDLIDPAILALLKKARGNPTEMTKIRPQLIASMRKRRQDLMKATQSEIAALH